MPPGAGGLARTEALRVDEAARLWTPTFRLLCASIFVLAAHYSLLVPALPLYVQALGGSTAFTGVLLVLFSAMSVASRPLVGYLSDTRSVPSVLMVGGVILAVASFGHLIPVLAVLAVVNPLRGLGWSSVNTSSNTLVAHIAPPRRRAEASSYFNLFQNSAHGIFPAVAVWIVMVPEMGFTAVFVLSGIFALTASALAFKMPATGASVPAAGAATPRPLTLGRFTFYDPRVLLAAGLLLCVTLTNPATQAFLPLHARDRGIMDLGWYFVANTAAGMLTYGLLGRALDRIGRATVIAMGFVLCIMGIGLLIVVSSLPVLLLAGVTLTVGQAVIATNTMALAIERADPRQRGAAFGTYTAAYSTGQGLGGLMAGLIAEFGGYTAMYVGAVIWTTLGLAFTLARWSSIGGAPPARQEAASG